MKVAMDFRVRQVFYPAVYIISCVALSYAAPADFLADDESDWIMMPTDRSKDSYYSSSRSYSLDSYSYYSNDVSSDVSAGHVTSDGGNDDNSVESFKSLHRLSSFLYNTHSIRRHGFRQMDADKDGYVTKYEYSLQNPRVDEEIVRTLFNILDSDGDDQLTEVELVSKTEFWDTSEDCEVFAIQQCDGRLTYTVERSDETTEEQAMCQGLQAYIDCLASEAAFCDFTRDFVNAVYTFADSYKSTKICRDLVTKDLANFAEWDSSSRRRRRSTTETADPVTHNSTSECAKVELSRCTVLFNRSLREAGDFCSTLHQYRHCINHAAKTCKDETLENLKESIIVLARLHKQFQVCDFH